MKRLALSSLLIILSACSNVPHRQGVIKLRSDYPLQPHINALVDGQEKTLVLDSGANVPFLRPSVNEPDRSKSTTPKSVVDVFGQTVHSVTIKYLNFKIGSIETNDVKTRISEELKSEGLPLKLIESSQMIFDFPKLEIRLGEQSTFCEPKAKFRSYKGLNYVRIRVGEDKYWLLWDTGASGSVLQQTLAKKYGWKPTLEMDLSINSPHRTEDPSNTGLFKTPIKIAGQNEDLYFITRDMSKTLAVLNDDANGVLGYNFIKRYKWFFDFNKKTYCFAKKDHP